MFKPTINLQRIKLRTLMIKIFLLQKIEIIITYYLHLKKFKIKKLWNLKFKKIHNMLPKFKTSRDLSHVKGV
jgi:hypothetical protein